MADSEAEEAERLLATLSARPRATGTGAESVARQHCIAWLESCGFTVREEEFVFSAFAGRIAAPLSGGILASMFILMAVSAAQGDTLLSLLVLVASLGTLGFVGVASRGDSILSSRTMRSRGVNLVATFRPLVPRVWLVAHLDSKSQPVSILARAAGVTASIIVAVAMIALLTAQLWSVHVPAIAWYILAVFGTLASVPLIRSTVGNDSRGTLDNASGVVAVLLAARRLSNEGVKGVGVLLTSAEELALAGAHAFCAQRDAGVALNCDSIDSRGEFYCLVGKRSGKTSAAVSSAAHLAETPVRSRRMFTGILVDSMAFEARGWDAVTLFKGDFTSLARIHTPRDCETEGMGAALSKAGQVLEQAAAKLQREN